MDITYTIDSADGEIWLPVETGTDTLDPGQSVHDAAKTILSNWTDDRTANGESATGWRVRVWSDSDPADAPDAEASTAPSAEEIDAARAVGLMESELTDWAAVAGQRNELFRRAVAAGVSKYRIGKLTGVARTTIDRIPGLEPSVTLRQRVEVALAEFERGDLWLISTVGGGVTLTIGTRYTDAPYSTRGNIAGSAIDILRKAGIGLRPEGNPDDHPDYCAAFTQFVPMVAYEIAAAE